MSVRSRLADARVVAETIHYWQDVGITAPVAWEALGHNRPLHGGWPAVRGYMMDWLEHEFEQSEWRAA